MRGSVARVGGRVGGARAADRRDPDGPRARRSCSSPTTIPAACSPRCARSTAAPARPCPAYLDLVGYRLLDGFDISNPCALELPDALLRAIRRGRRRDGRRRVGRRGPDRRRARQGPRGAPGRVRRAARGSAADLPAPRRARRLQRHLGLRAHAAGGARGAVAALADAGAASTRPLHLVDAGLDEMCALLAGAGGPSADELAARAAVPRVAHAPRTRRRRSGPPPPPPPDPSGLPPAVARMMRATGIALGRAVRQLRGRARGAPAARAGGEPGRLRRAGPAASPDPSEFDRIVQGDVLVTESTTEAFNILLPLLGAIVTDSGGLLSHSAIVAREYGIPGVVGTREATERIADGARVRVDGDAGEVDGARVKRRRPAREGARRRRSSARRRSGSGRRSATACPVPPGVALSGPIVEAVAAGDEPRDQGGREVGPDRSAARSRCARPRSTRTAPTASFAGPAPDAAQRPVGRRAAVGVERDLVVGELGLGDHLPPARRPLHAPERRRRRPVAARPRDGRRHVHEEPGHRRRRAGDRGELGARRGGRRGPRDPRPLPGRPLGPGARAHARAQADRDPRRRRRRHGRGGGRGRARREALPRRRPARAS